MTAETASPAAEPAAPAWTWLLQIASPTVWLIDLQASYVLVYWACSAGSGLLLLVISAFALLAECAIALFAWRIYRNHRSIEQTDSAVPQQGSFLALLALLQGVLFILLVLATAIPRVVLDPCAR